MPMIRRRREGWRAVRAGACGRARGAALAAAVLAAASGSAAATATRPPKVMLLIDERNLGSVPTAEVEALVGEKLLAAGVELVDQEMVRSSLKRDRDLMKLAGEARGAAVVGLQYGADILVSGEAVAKPSARRIAESNLRTFEATVTFRAVRTDNAVTLATVARTASVFGLDDTSGGSKALKTAGEQAVGEMLPKMLDGWRKGTAVGTDTGKVILKASGVDQMWKLNAVNGALEKMADGLANVQMLSYMAGLAVFEAQPKIAGAKIAEQLVLNPPEKLRVQVLNVSAGEIQFRVVPAP
jgi:hypothetical protein